MDDRTDRFARKRDRGARLLSVASILFTRGGTESGVPVAEIAALTGVTTRTVYRDLRALDEELGTPIYEAGRGRYGIEKKYFLPPLQLAVPEAVVLFLAARLIARWSDETDQVVISAFTKLAHLLPQPIARHVAASMLLVGRAAANEPFTRNFGVVARAWAEGRVIVLEYEAPGGRERRQARVRPYFLEPDAAGHSVYLIGFDETVSAMRTYKVERIRGVRLTEETYQIPDDFDPDHYLRHAWGIWSSDSTPAVEVHLRFDASVAHRVRETVWHHSQRLTELGGGRVELRLRVAGIVEIRPWVLSWGEAVEVLGPPELRRAVAAAVRAAASRYAGDDAG